MLSKFIQKTKHLPTIDGDSIYIPIVLKKERFGLCKIYIKEFIYVKENMLFYLAETEFFDQNVLK